eukprot:m.105549 g.105549  ORF g.105549 m.105549 type:complete len:51 (+) comp9133_c0_seq7:1207-1359(+)
MDLGSYYYFMGREEEITLLMQKKMLFIYLSIQNQVKEITYGQDHISEGNA